MHTSIHTYVYMHIHGVANAVISVHLSTVKMVTLIFAEALKFWFRMFVFYARMKHQLSFKHSLTVSAMI